MKLALLLLTVSLLWLPPFVAEGADGATLFKRSKDAVVMLRTEEGAGTGFVVEGGQYIVTAEHVVDGAVRISVDGKPDQIEYVAYADKQSDIAILKLRTKRSKTLSLRKGAAPSPGSKIYVIGAPLGFLEDTISDGIVSGVRKLSTHNLIQFTASVSPGSSGGPVLDGSGRVVGIVQGHLERGQTLNFAVSAFDISKAISLVSRSAIASKSTGKQMAAKMRSPTGEVLGILAQATSEASIYSSPKTSSRVYHRLKPDEYFIAQTVSKDGWVHVLMENGRTGYVVHTRIRLLPYRVTDAAVVSRN